MREHSRFSTKTFWEPHLSIFAIGFLFLFLFEGSNATCPIEIRPPTLVVRYGDSASADCNTSVSHTMLGWESSVGEMQKISENISRWSIAELKDWDFDPPFCFLNHEDQCEDNLNVIVYKTPESVSISTVKDIGAMIEGNQYELQCDVHNVAPARSVTVKWYKEQTLLYQTNFTDAQKTPVSQISKFMIHPNRTDDGTRFWCEAEMNLGEAGPQPPPKNSSNNLIIAVHYKPIIDENKLSSVVTVIRGYPIELVCKAEGKPEPTIIWRAGTETIHGEKYTVKDASQENLFCTATNSAGNTTKSVQVVFKDITISRVDSTRPVIAGEQYDLQCFIQNIAENAVVRWYKGGRNIFNQTINSETLLTPVNETSRITIHPNREDDVVQFRSKPIINETKLLSVVPVFRGYPMELICEADGKPKPAISWKVKDEIIYGGSLNITETAPEILYCIANNSVHVTIKEVKVVLKEDYLPLIAGLVAIMVAFISVFFIFIYSIYYKTAKMGRYSLKDAKPCAQNGDIAQNGKDSTIPMKKLSQSSILA
ncbi:hypothetical protein DNTS_003962 [Danionella cerebrum]|uniref:Ig-like domain-containing protein n=1 Tax=Danionella cerebrum TaxID=2873325 RepID=A0A553Q1D7_9TELE|nr:hypothetical protein DNTS_003962 [Danionella translucida]